jgi:hypothetical protein
MSAEIRRCVLKFFGAADGVADEMPLLFSHGVIEFSQRVISESTNFWVEFATSRLDLAPSATASATHEISRSRQVQCRTLLAALKTHAKQFEPCEWCERNRCDGLR